MNSSLTQNHGVKERNQYRFLQATLVTSPTSPRMHLQIKGQNEYEYKYMEASELRRISASSVITYNIY